MHTGHDERTRAVLEHARRRLVERETRVEALPETLEQRLASIEEQVTMLREFQSALIREATNKLKMAG